jgi:hypothetical protein
MGEHEKKGLADEFEKKGLVDDDAPEVEGHMLRGEDAEGDADEFEKKGLSEGFEKKG